MPSSLFAKAVVLSDKLYHNGELLVSYTISYPFFRPDTDPSAMRLNTFYRREAMSFQRYARQVLWKEAFLNYEESQTRGFPFRTFEAVMNFQVTYNQNCAISLFLDRYEYRGGAHGVTVRTSDTWSIPGPGRITLAQLYPGQPDYKKYVLQRIKEKITWQIKNGENIYFEDFDSRLNTYFNPKDFYLTPGGVVFYFQQYAIAPYAASLPQFTIPYSRGGAVSPRCPRES